MHEATRTGLDYLGTVTTLLQRVRNAHPTDGLYQAAELQFWWSRPRSTDTVPQLFWFDDEGRPEAAVTVTDFGDGSSLLYEDPTMVITTMPGASFEWQAHVVKRGLAHHAEIGITAVELEVEQHDEPLRTVLLDHGFTVKGSGMRDEGWLDAEARPAISPLPDGYRLLSRADTINRPHHLGGPDRRDLEQRLGWLSLYRPDLDLFIADNNGDLAAYGMFWHDPVTGTGVVEPMRTADEHQGLGLARHVLTAGLDRLDRLGCKRITIGWDPHNPASSHLYLDVGFERHRRTDLLARSAS